ncbi:hypothetical protein [Siminovitchia fordii]|uniref:Uncharacterized protein n=1 Tax=Siminovitchia fordii TaxID=254759 RepID=A0ABQ4KA36_9BACI|nr:hypothetical protein [Siminovitchia fordii]GIN22582.1 hypothetical protein J1TS3_37160 [Siminovitchia fordii]
MFKFQRIFSGGEQWTDNLYKENEYIGKLGKDKYGLFINLQRDLTLGEINLLIAQLSNAEPLLLTEKIEIQKSS